MNKKEMIDYIREELDVINERLNEFTKYGYASFLSPLVDTMCEYEKKLKALEVEEMESILKKKKENL